MLCMSRPAYCVLQLLYIIYDAASVSMMLLYAAPELSLAAMLLLPA
jgi:hypothetical protein